MKITFLGGADEVGASSIFIEIAGQRILVDAGIRPSPKVRWGLAGDQLPDLSGIERMLAQSSGDGPAVLDAVLVTHAHTDHTGALELVAERFPKVPFYATPPTIALTRVLHLDSQRIMQSRLEEEGELPLFDSVAVTKLFSAFTPVPFHTTLPLGEGLSVTFFPAGHIAGAAMIGLESDEGRVLITGDLSISPQRTVEGARVPPFRPDVLIMESTYGGRLHANRVVEERRLVEAVGETLAGGGKVLIPAFALGRAQELLLILGEFQRRGELPNRAVWADGMVRAICQAYSSFPEYLPLPLQERGARFFEGQIRPVQSVAQRNALIYENEPGVIISSSGMLAGGPSQAYAKALAGQKQHAIFLTGYQDEEAPGRKLQEMAQRGQGTLRFGNDKIDVQCRLGTYSLSAHADEAQLINLAEILDPAEILLVHGDDAARDQLALRLAERGRSVQQPRAGQTLVFQFEAALARRLNQAGLAKTPLGHNQVFSIQNLWEALVRQFGSAQASPYFSTEDLARLWWGQDWKEAATGKGSAAMADLEAALDKDDLFFSQHIFSSSQSERRPLYRMRSAAQVDALRRQQAEIQSYASQLGAWLLVRPPSGSPQLARLVALHGLDLHVEPDDPSAWEGETYPVTIQPKAVLQVIGPERPAEEMIEAYRHRAPGGVMEPNQALELARSAFPPEARLRKTGYRLEQQRLVLTFDFPRLVNEQYASLVRQVEGATGWTVEIPPETNQAALNSLVRECLPEGWIIRKGPSLFLSERRVSVTVSPPEIVSRPRAQLDAAAEKFQATSGYQLETKLVEAGIASMPKVASAFQAGRPEDELRLPEDAPQAAAGERLEINTAYTVIKQALEGSTLYRTSLKGETIVLAFISAAVGERYRPQMEALERRTGWQLSIHPNPNQEAVLEIARSLVQAQGWVVTKGPSLHIERGEVAVTLTSAPAANDLDQVQSEFETQTGLRLAIQPMPGGDDTAVVSTSPRPAAPGGGGETVEVPLDRIRLSGYHERLELSPDKLRKTVQRALRDGTIQPPIQVRRLQDGYLLVDGLYRLRAAQELRLERVWVEIVEGRR